jgi:hypothetical protein
MQPSKTTRRSFLQRGLALGAAPLLLLQRSQALGYSANESLDLALIGVGGRGRWFVEAIPRIGENVVAMCDVNKQKAAESFDKIPQAKKFVDFRKMLDALDHQLDGVIIAVPDHNHAPITMRAMQAGKHVFCEKPLTNNIEEARIVRHAAKKSPVATQMGNQGTATHAFREQVEILRSSLLGEIQEVIVWNTGGGAGPIPQPQEGEPVADYLDWNLWLGPRPMRPYHRQWMQWHRWREFGTGNLGNWAIHSANVADMAFWLFSLWDAVDKEPTSRTIEIEAEVSDRSKIAVPKWEKITYRFPERRGMPPLKLTWLNGLSMPGFRESIEPHLGRRLVAGGNDPWIEHAGCLVIGSEGKLHSTSHNSTYTLLPEEKFENIELPKPTLPRSGSHEREWLAACRGQGKAMSNFADYAGPHTEFVLLGNVATQFEGPLRFDPVAMEFFDHPEANAALGRSHRKGWEVKI